MKQIKSMIITKCVIMNDIIIDDKWIIKSHINEEKISPLCRCIILCHSKKNIVAVKTIFNIVNNKFYFLQLKINLKWRKVILSR